MKVPDSSITDINFHHLAPTVSESYYSCLRLIYNASWHALRSNIDGDRRRVQGFLCRHRIKGQSCCNHRSVSDCGDILTFLFQHDPASNHRCLLGYPFKLRLNFKQRFIVGCHSTFQRWNRTRKVDKLASPWEHHSKENVRDSDS